MSWQSAAVGAIGLCLLDVVLTSDVAVARLGSISPGPVLKRIIDPSVPLFGPVVVTTAATTPAAAPAGTTAPAAGLTV